MNRFCDEWLLLPQRLALHEPSATAVLADVHLGYSAARQRLGDAVPCRTVEEEMQPLAAAALAHDIQQLIVAGDLFERGFDAELGRQFVDVLRRLGIRLVGVVPGNHDRGIEAASAELPILPTGIDWHGWRISHGDQTGDQPRAIIGHWHPAIRYQHRKRPAFMLRGSQLILPAFSRDAAGADVRGDERWQGWFGQVIVGNEVIELAERTLPRPRRSRNR